MDLNMIFLVGFGAFIAYIGYRSLNTKSILDPIPTRTGLLVAQDTGKSKQIQSKTGDASLNIEKVRIRTIQGSGRVQKNKLKETHTQFGSTTGAVETFMISSICPVLPCPPVPVIQNLLLNAGGASDEICNIFDDQNGLGCSYDAGEASTSICR